MIEITESKYTSSERASIYKMQKICLPSDDVCKIHKASDVWIVAKSGKQFAGFGGIRFLYDDVWYLCRAGVLPDFQGQGLQKRLIQARIDAAICYNAKLVITDCTSDNYGSANSLIGAGFKMFKPCYNWALPNSLYWRKDL